MSKIPPDEIDLFKNTIKKMGGEKPLVEWTPRSGLVGFEYLGHIHRWHVPGNSRTSEMRESMIMATQTAVLALRDMKVGIRRVSSWEMLANAKTKQSAEKSEK